MTLTERQEAILRFITEYIAANGYPPTLREIGRAFGVRSTNGVNDHLRALERKGRLMRTDNQARSMRVVNARTGERMASPADALSSVKAENEALRALLRRVSAAGARAPSITAELAIILGDVRAVVGSAA